MFAFVIAGLLVLIGTILALGSRLGAKELESCPSLTCAEAAQATGPAKLSGEARCEEPLLSPVSRRPCIHYALRIVETVASGDRLKLVERVSRSEWAHFWVADDSGALVVDAQGAELVGGKATSLDHHGFDEETVSQLLRDYDQIANLDDCTVIEKLVPVGARLFVRGELQETNAGTVLGGGSGLLVSTRSEKALMGKERSAFHAGIVLVLLGLLVAGGALVISLDASDEVTPAAAGPLKPFAPRPGR